MSLPTLPDYVLIDLDGYTESPDYGVKRGDMDGGLPKQRPTRSLPVVERSLSMLLQSQDDKTAFDLWWRQELAGGVGWFTLSLFGQLLQARFVGKSSAKPRGIGKWTITATIETIG